MHRADRDRKSGRGRPGFTLAEVLVCSVILALVFVAMLAALGQESVIVQSGEDVTVATFLAEEIRDMALRMPFQDVLNLNGAVYNPAVLSTGAAQCRPEFAQVVSVVPVNAEDLSATVSAANATAAHLVVMVRARGNQVLIQDYYVLDVSGVRYAQQ